MRNDAIDIHLAHKTQQKSLLPETSLNGEQVAGGFVLADGDALKLFLVIPV